MHLSLAGAGTPERCRCCAHFHSRGFLVRLGCPAGCAAPSLTLHPCPPARPSAQELPAPQNGSPNKKDQKAAAADSKARSLLQRWAKVGPDEQRGAVPRCRAALLRTAVPRVPAHWGACLPPACRCAVCGVGSHAPLQPPLAPGPHPPPLARLAFPSSSLQLHTYRTALTGFAFGSTLCGVLLLNKKH